MKIDKAAFLKLLDFVDQFPHYFLDYRQEAGAAERWADRFTSQPGDWSGNVYDFYFRVYNRLQQGIKVPFTMEGPYRVDDTPVHQAIREALANCLVNADYYGRQGLVILNKRGEITMSNPGVFRIEIDAAKSGGVSDPRNSTMLKMFNFIDIGERAGSGIPNIFRVWKEQKWSAPTLIEEFDPDRLIVSLPLKIVDKKPAIKSGDKKVAIKSERHKNAIIEFLTDHPEGTVAELEDVLGLKASRVKQLLGALSKEGIIEAIGSNRNRRYRLKR